MFGIVSLGFNSLLTKCLELKKRVHYGMYTYPISKHQRDIPGGVWASIVMSRHGIEAKVDRFEIN